jgi:hypothetical protein
LEDPKLLFPKQPGVAPVVPGLRVLRWARGTMSEWYADVKPSGKKWVPDTGPDEYEDPLSMTEMRK